MWNVKEMDKQSMALNKMRGKQKQLLGPRRGKEKREKRSRRGGGRGSRDGECRRGGRKGGGREEKGGCLCPVWGWSLPWALSESPVLSLCQTGQAD